MVWCAVIVPITSDLSNYAAFWAFWLKVIACLLGALLLALAGIFGVLVAILRKLSV